MSSFKTELYDLLGRYFDELSLNYSIPKSELVSLWSDGDVKKPTTKSKAKPSEPKQSDSTNEPSSTEPVSNTPTNTTELDKMAKTELTALCKARGLKTSGTKSDLIARISGNAPPEKPPQKSKSPQKSSTAKKESKKDQPFVSDGSKIKSIIQSQQITYKITKNEFGNFVHGETNLVFDKDKKLFYGKQMPSGSIAQLTDEDIETCNKFKFKYELPVNLGSSAAGPSKDFELDDDEELVDDEEQPEELEELEDQLMDE